MARSRSRRSLVRLFVAGTATGALLAGMAAGNATGAPASDKLGPGHGILMVHLHNLTGNTAHVVNFVKAKPRVKLTFWPSTIKKGKATRVTVTVTGPAGEPTGSVTIKRLNGTRPGTLKSVTLVNGTASFKYKPTSTGSFIYQATYAGDQIYTGGTSAFATMKVTG